MTLTGLNPNRLGHHVCLVVPYRAYHFHMIASRSTEWYNNDIYVAQSIVFISIPDADSAIGAGALDQCDTETVAHVSRNV